MPKTHEEGRTTTVANARSTKHVTLQNWKPELEAVSDPSQPTTPGSCVSAVAPASPASEGLQQSIKTVVFLDKRINPAAFIDTLSRPQTDHPAPGQNFKPRQYRLLDRHSSTTLCCGGLSKAQHVRSYGCCCRCPWTSAVSRRSSFEVVP